MWNKHLLLITTINCFIICEGTHFKLIRVYGDRLNTIKLEAIINNQITMFFDEKNDDSHHNKITTFQIYVRHKCNVNIMLAIINYNNFPENISNTLQQCSK